MFTLTQVNFWGLAFESIFFSRSWVKTFLPNIFGYCIINNWALGTFTHFNGLLLPKKICSVIEKGKCRCYAKKIKMEILRDSPTLDIGLSGNFRTHWLTSSNACYVFEFDYT